MMRFKKLQNWVCGHVFVETATLVQKQSRGIAALAKNGDNHHLYHLLNSFNRVVWTCFPLFKIGPFVDGGM
jgi:hypothetical protein